jgi:transaldolase
MIRNPEEQGQSVWLDLSSLDLVRSGGLVNLVQTEGVSGLTVEPAVLAEALGPNGGNRSKLHGPLNGKPPAAAGQKTIVEKIQAIANILSPIYIATQWRGGSVSLPINPAVANDTEATLAEARRLWNETSRENLLVGVPATDAGIPAISALIAERINVNATMIFTPQRYEQAALAYLDGLEKLAARRNNNASIAGIAGVASFYLSPIDTAVDAVISSHLNQCGFIKTYNALERETLKSLVGKAAIASAKAAYDRFQGIFSGPRWEALAAMGAQEQRLLWAGTAVENPAYREMKYLDALTEPDTIMAMSPALLATREKYGERRKSTKNDSVPPSPYTRHEHAGDAAMVLSELRKLHISLDEIAERLLSSRLRRQAG